MKDTPVGARHGLLFAGPTLRVFVIFRRERACFPKGGCFAI